MKFKRSDFPPNFIWGTATSAYQIEGRKFGGAGMTHWDTFAATPGNVVNGEDGAVACDHYHQFEADLDLVADANLDAYSFTISWGRVLPEGTGQINPKGLDFYDRLVDAILERGLKPKATLYHWDLPSPLADKGGWTNRDTTDHFANFTRVIMERIGDRLWSAAPVNEPWCVSWLSHFLGHHAPGLRDIRATARAMHHILLAHGQSIEVMRDFGMNNLGAVCNFEYAQAADDSIKAQAAASRYDAIYNQFFMSGMFLGEYPTLALKGLEPHLPKNWQDDMPLISQPLDWVGINYYTRKIIASDNGAWPQTKEVEGPLPKTDMGWEIYPEGLLYFLKTIAKDYTGNIPLFVTENGMASKTEPDHDRMSYISSHVNEVRKAINQGIPVQGYYVWSLLDNYEWALGYDKRFGLVKVDFDTLERHPKGSYFALQKALANV